VIAVPDHEARNSHLATQTCYQLIALCAMPYDLCALRLLPQVPPRAGRSSSAALLLPYALSHIVPLALCPMRHALCPLPSALCLPREIHISDSAAYFTGALCSFPLRSALYPMLYALCPMLFPSALCPMLASCFCQIRNPKSQIPNRIFLTSQHDRDSLVID